MFCDLLTIKSIPVEDSLKYIRYNLEPENPQCRISLSNISGLSDWVQDILRSFSAQLSTRSIPHWSGSELAIISSSCLLSLLTFSPCCCLFSSCGSSIPLPFLIPSPPSCPTFHLYFFPLPIPLFIHTNTHLCIAFISVRDEIFLDPRICIHTNSFNMISAVCWWDSACMCLILFPPLYYRWLSLYPDEGPPCTCPLCASDWSTCVPHGEGLQLSRDLGATYLELPSLNNFFVGRYFGSVVSTFILQPV